jgi:hypothetical protein
MYKTIKNYFLIATLVFWGWSVSVRADDTRSTTTTTTTDRVEDSGVIDADTHVDHPMDDVGVDRSEEVRTRTTEVTTDEPVVKPSENQAAAERNAAGLFVEPGFTYESLDTNITWPTAGASGGSIRGVGLMGRLGFHANESLFIAMDGRYVKPTYEDSGTKIDTDASLYDYGPVVGIQMPFKGMRLWGQYVMGGQLDSNEQNGLDFRFDQSQGYRIGAGFHVQAVSVNVEYQDLSYRTNLQGAGAAGFTADTNFETSDLASKGVIASITFPFGI